MILLPIVAIAIALSVRSRVRAMEQSINRISALVGRLQYEAHELRRRLDATVGAQAESQGASEERSVVGPEQTAGAAAPPHTGIEPKAEPVAAFEAPIRPPARPQPPPAIEPAPAVSTVQVPTPPAPRKRERLQWGSINWEQFVGAKVFAWAAGLALFLGVSFFIKWSFDRGLITPPIRVTMGFVVGAGLLIGGLRVPRPRYAVLGQSLVAAGALILYAAIFASCAFYHFISTPVAFPLMVLVTVTAFLLAVRLDAAVVAILGLLGGFLTPPLLSTGVDRPFGLFGYVALLDAGLIAVALRKRWHYLVLLAALATVAMQYGWANKFFQVEKMPVATGIFLTFAVLFLIVLAIARRRNLAEGYLAASSIILPLSALGFAWYVQARPYAAIVSAPALLFVLVFGADAVLLGVAALRPKLRLLHLVGGGFAFFQLAFWTINHLETRVLDLALGAYLVFGIMHTVFPVVIERAAPSGHAAGWGQLFAPLALILVMLPMFEVRELSLLIWPVVLLLDLLAIVVAFLTASLLSIFAALALTCLAIAFWILRVPVVIGRIPESLVITGAFAVLFFCGWDHGGAQAGRRVCPRQECVNSFREGTI